MSVGVPVDGAASFDAYVAEHQAALVRYATLLTGSVAAAEDIVQDVLVRLYPRWSTLADPHPYVRRSITNQFVSWTRRWSTRHVHNVPDATLVGAAERASFSNWTEAPGADPTLWQALGRLPHRQRAAVVLRYWEGLSDDEIADLLGCRPPSVRSNVSRGLAKLRASLMGEEGRA